jgi:predicted nucleotide-binding protein (sugar kinase/HSP70/actin superfamily)
MTATAKQSQLTGRKLWIPRMTYAGARLSAAAFRSVGLDAAEVPESNEQTLELGGLFSSGEECYPAKITLGDFLRILRADDFDPDRTAFFMPGAQGPCRFGQYGPYLRHVLDEMGHTDVPVISPTSSNGYADIAAYGITLTRRMWRGIVTGDLLTKMLLKTRPYETEPGKADEAFEQSLALVERPLSDGKLSDRQSLAEMVEALEEAAGLFELVPARYTRGKPLIGVVGEIFCRLNTFSNYEAVRAIEAHGGEAWLSDVTEWVFYTNWSQRQRLKGWRRFSGEAMVARIRHVLQHGDERALAAPLAEHFVGYEEPHDVGRDVLEPGWPYLPADGALGEMALSVGRSIYLYGKGVDGIIAISPFTCMNGIVSEAVYHDVSSDHDDLPIRNFYFDDSSSNMQRDLDIFMELTRSYRDRKPTARRYPAYFENHS